MLRAKTALQTVGSVPGATFAGAPVPLVNACRETPMRRIISAIPLILCLGLPAGPVAGAGRRGRPGQPAAAPAATESAPEAGARSRPSNGFAGERAHPLRGSQGRHALGNLIALPEEPLEMAGPVGHQQGRGAQSPLDLSGRCADPGLDRGHAAPAPGRHGRRRACRAGWATSCRCPSSGPRCAAKRSTRCRSRPSRPSFSIRS